MATKDELLQLYDSLKADAEIGNDKQVDFIILLSKIIYLLTLQQTNKENPPKLDVLDTQIDIKNIHNSINSKGQKNSRSVSEKLSTLAISIHAKNSKERRILVEEKKIGPMLRAYRSKAIPIPSIDEFKRALGIKVTSWDPFGNLMATPMQGPSTRAPSEFTAPARTALATLRPVAPPPRAMPSVVGTEPFRSLSADLQARCRTLEGLNAYIAALYPGDRSSTPAGHQNVQAIVSKCTTNPGLLLSIRKWRPKESRGYRNDCLVESFLTVTCPAFRILEGRHKDEVAEGFRQFFFASQPEVTTHRNSRRLLDELNDHRFLGNEHLSILSSIYGVDVLMLESAALGGAGATLFEINNSARVYIIINPNNAHYEGVQPRPDDEDYGISRDEATRALQCITARGIAESEGSRGLSQRICLPTGTPVLYRGGRYVIFEGKVMIDRNTGEGIGCEGYYLTTPDNLRAFTALPDSFNEGGRRLYKESTALKRRYLSFPDWISPGEVQAIATVAAARAANVGALASAGAPLGMATLGVSKQQTAANANLARRLAADEEQKSRNKEAQEAANSEFARRVAAGEFDGGARRRSRTLKAPKHSLRAKRGKPSKGKRYGSRRRR